MNTYSFHSTTTEIQRTALVLTLRKAGFTASRESDTLRTNATRSGIALVWGNSLVVC